MTAFEDPAALRAKVRPPVDVAKEYPAPFPLPWYDAILQRLRERGVRTITYRELFDTCDDRDHESGYAREYQSWRERWGGADHPFLLIQHDVDFVPPFTERMVALEALHGCHSNIFLFNELNRDFPEGSPYDDSPYEPDVAFLQQAERAGFVIGYHQNALALTAGDLDEAQQRFLMDVRALRQHFTIDFFCPHGGRGREIAGTLHRNYDVPVPPELRGDLRWVYNRYALRFAGRYSDGGLRTLRDPERLAQLDVMRFIDSMQPGQRYFMLIHPQLWGYHVNPRYNPTLIAQPWYRDVLARFDTSPTV